MKKMAILALLCSLVMVGCWDVDPVPPPDDCPNDTADYYEVTYIRAAISCPQGNDDDGRNVIFFFANGSVKDVNVAKIDDYHFLGTPTILIPRNDNLGGGNWHRVYAVDGAVSDCVTIGTGYTGQIIILKNTRTGVRYQLTQVVPNTEVSNPGGTMAEFRRNCDGSISPATVTY